MKKLVSPIMIAITIAMIVFLVIIWTDAEIPVPKIIIPSICYLYILVDSLRRGKKRKEQNRTEN